VIAPARSALRRVRYGVRAAARLRGWRAGGLAAALGALSVTGFAPLFWLPVYVACLSGLVLMLEQARRFPRPVRAAAWRGFAFGFGQFLAGTFWVANAFLVNAQDYAWLLWMPLVLMPAGLALFPAAAAALFAVAPVRLGDAALRFALAFFLAELARSTVLSGFPWNLPGHVWPAGGAVSQSAALIGATGLSFFTLHLAAAPAALAGTGALSARLAPVALAAMVFSLAGVFGVARLPAEPVAETETRLRLVVLDLPQAEKRYENRDAILQRYLSLTAAPGLSEVDAVIWPEGAIPALLLREPGLLAEIAPVLQGGPPLLTGVTRLERQAARDQYFNSLAALGFTPEGPRLLGVYDKARLVPFGETNPFRGLTERLGFDTLAQLASGYDAGPGAAALQVGGVPPFAPLICYEVIFPRFASGLSEPEPVFLLNISNDSWFGHSSGPRQHYNQAAYRAIESGLPLIRAASSGVSGQADPYGRIKYEIPLKDDYRLDVQLLESTKKPAYSQYGVWCWGLAILIFVLSAASLRYVIPRR